MIFTLLGTHEQQFDRLIKAVASYSTSMPKVVQYGYSEYLPNECKLHKFLEFDLVVEFMKCAETVITHSGTGCVMLALSLGITPIVAPRYHKYGEHVDDHQLQLCHYLASKNLITPFYDGDDLTLRIKENLKKKGRNRKIEPDIRLVKAVNELIMI